MNKKGQKRTVKIFQLEQLSPEKKYFDQWSFLYVILYNAV